MPTILKRSLSGAVYVALVVCSILAGPMYSGVVFLLLAVLALMELNRMMVTKFGSSVPMWQHVVASILMSVVTMFLTGQEVRVDRNVELQEFVRNNYIVVGAQAVYLLFVFGCMVGELFRKKDPIVNWMTLILGQFYISLPMSLLNTISTDGSYQWAVVLAVFVVIWVNDTGAYLSGMALGRHKMFPRVSPKKSWEGLIGGAVLAVGAAMCFAYYTEYLSYFEWMLFALVVVVCGTFGDLVESIMKRTVGVKDSGNIMPGHGGILDRIDSVLLASIGAYAYLHILYLVD